MRQEYDFSKGVRGRVVSPRPNTTQIILRVDDDILDWFRERVAEGGDYQIVINAALRDYMKRAEDEDQRSKISTD